MSFQNEKRNFRSINNIDPHIYCVLFQYYFRVFKYFYPTGASNLPLSDSVVTYIVVLLKFKRSQLIYLVSVRHTARQLSGFGWRGGGESHASQFVSAREGGWCLRGGGGTCYHDSVLLLLSYTNSVLVNLIPTPVCFNNS